MYFSEHFIKLHTAALLYHAAHREYYLTKGLERLSVVHSFLYEQNSVEYLVPVEDAAQRYEASYLTKLLSGSKEVSLRDDCGKIVLVGTITV